MRRHLIVPLASLLLLSACSTIQTVKVSDPNSAPDGVRVFPPKVYLAVDKQNVLSQVYVLPDYQRAYDIKPIRIWSKNDFSVELDDGKLSKLTSNEDTTAILTFINQAGQAAAKGAGIPVAGSAAIKGTFGLVCLLKT